MKLLGFSVQEFVIIQFLQSDRRVYIGLTTRIDIAAVSLHCSIKFSLPLHESALNAVSTAVLSHIYRPHAGVSCDALADCDFTVEKERPRCLRGNPSHNHGAAYCHVIRRFCAWHSPRTGKHPTRKTGFFLSSMFHRSPLLPLPGALFHPRAHAP